MPGELTSLSRPIKLLSLQALQTAWYDSRDSTTRPGTYGIDRVRATEFASKLRHKLQHINEHLRSGTYRFTPLRLRLIDKKQAGKYRAICIPTVQDRLVQRAIAGHLIEGDRLGLRSQVSFGFIRGIGVPEAIDEATRLRHNLRWVLKTDISAFFDNIDRSRLIQKLMYKIPKSLVPLVHQVIGCEIQVDDEVDRQRLESMGIRDGHGLRQGMPLSPILSNFVLREFDRRVMANGLRMVRYADDLLFCFSSKADAERARIMIVDWLARIGHTVPDLGTPHSKTRIVSPEESVEFLGFDLKYDTNCNAYAKFVPRNTIKRIASDLEALGSIRACDSMRPPWNFHTLTMKISAKASSYLHAYDGARNHVDLKTAINRASKKALNKVLAELFGSEAVRRLSPASVKFLGLDTTSRV